MAERIYVADDELHIRTLIQTFLANEGYEVRTFADGDSLFQAFSERCPDLIILDIMMPGTDGLSLCARIRGESRVPIMIVSAKDSPLDRVTGITLGSDDYMVKPIELDELLLRVEALLRRAGIASSKRLCVGNLVMDSEERTAYVDEEEVPLTVREFDILYKLLSYPKKTFTRAQLMDEFWGYETESDSRTVDVYITRLRNKFKACTAFEIVTVHGLGYKAVLHENGK